MPQRAAWAESAVEGGVCKSASWRVGLKAKEVDEVVGRFAVGEEDFGWDLEDFGAVTGMPA